MLKSLAQKVKTIIKFALQHLGLINYAQKIRMLPYRDRKEFTVTLNGITVRFSTQDEYSKSWFFPRYAGRRIHERVVTEMLIEALQSARCFVDVGTNLGWYTCVAAMQMPGGIVYGFEMDDLNFALLEKNIAINNCPNVEVYNLALSDSSGVVSYKRDENRPNPGFYIDVNTKDENSTGVMSVNSVTLDEFLQGKEAVPDVIKIDVEGAEMNVLMGMRQTLINYMPVLFLEIHPSNLNYFKTSTSAILSFLIESGYQVFEIEDLRLQEAIRRLKPLLPDSMINGNAMVYATTAQESSTNAA